MSPTPPIPRASVLVPPATLREWADGLSALPSSPLARWAGSGTAEAATIPDDERLRWMAATLSRPGRRLNASVMAPDGIVAWEFHGTAEGWLGAWPEAGGLRLSGPISTVEVATFLAAFYLDRPTATSTPWADIGPAGLTALAGLIDATLTGSTSPGAKPGDGVDLADIGVALAVGQSAAGSVSKVRVVTAWQPRLLHHFHELPSGLRELSVAGLALREADRHVPAGFARNLVAIPQQLPALTLAGSDAATLVMGVGEAALQVETFGSRYRVRLASHDDVTSALIAQIDADGAAPKPPPAPIALFEDGVESARAAAALNQRLDRPDSAP